MRRRNVDIVHFARSVSKKAGTVGKILTVGINTPEFYEYSQEQKTESLPRRKKWRNEESHGLDRARGYGLKSMSRQAKLTAIAVNLKRIAKILSSLMGSIHQSTTIFLKIIKRNNRFRKNSVFLINI